MNSFDILFLGYCGFQGIRGYFLGFSKMLYSAVKWVFILGGSGLLYQNLMPLISKIPFYVEISQGLNLAIGSVLKDITKFISQGEIANFIGNIFYNIPYDKIAIIIGFMILCFVLIRSMILGFKPKKSKNRIGGILIGLLKSYIYMLIIMISLSPIMNVINPDAFYNWQSESIVLKTINLIF